MGIEELIEKYGRERIEDAVYDLKPTGLLGGWMAINLSRGYPVEYEVLEAVGGGNRKARKSNFDDWMISNSAFVDDDLYYCILEEYELPSRKDLVDDMNIEWFASQPMASIQTSGRIGLLGGVVKKYGLEDWEYVVRGFDSDTGQVVLSRCEEATSGAVRMAYSASSRIWTVIGKSFLDYHGIDYSKNRKFPVKYIEDKEMLVFTVE